MLTQSRFLISYQIFDNIQVNNIYFNINVDDAIYEVLTMPREEITI